MYFTKRLLLLTICIVTFGSAKKSQFLEYSIDTPSVEESIDRLIQKENQGFNVEIEVSPFHPKSPDQYQQANDLNSKSHRSYCRKSAYY